MKEHIVPFVKEANRAITFANKYSVVCAVQALEHDARVQNEDILLQTKTTGHTSRSPFYVGKYQDPWKKGTPNFSHQMEFLISPCPLWQADSSSQEPTKSSGSPKSGIMTLEALGPMGPVGSKNNCWAPWDLWAP